MAQIPDISVDAGPPGPDASPDPLAAQGRGFVPPGTPPVPLPDAAAAELFPGAGGTHAPDAADPGLDHVPDAAADFIAPGTPHTVASPAPAPAKAADSGSFAPPPMPSEQDGETLA